TADVFVVQQMTVLVDENGQPMQIHLKLDKGTGRQGLQKLLQPFNLTYVVLGDTLLVTTEEMGLQRQMRQRTSVAVDNSSVEGALKKIARAHGINLVIDPKIAKEAQAPVTLNLEDATLETAVRLLAEMGGLKSVRMGNVLFVTDAAKAEKLRQEDKHNQPQF